MRAQKNYQKMLEATIAGLKEQNRVPTLLLHSCCAPCSSLRAWSICRSIFRITVDFITTPISIRKQEYGYAGGGAAAAD